MNLNILSLEKVRLNSGLRDLIPSFLALCLALPVSFLIYYINQSLPGQPEKDVLVVAGAIAVLFILPPGNFLFLLMARCIL